LAVALYEFRELGVAGIRRWGRAEQVLYDLKYVLPKDGVDLRL
jgi:UDP-N-acetyl-D-glucosamine/UDP-N-acetyl-D-galactosamine dehydrogenase